MAEKCRTAAPVLLSCGGARRTIVLAPAGTSPEQIAQANPDIPAASLNFLNQDRNEIVICQEILDVPIDRVVKQLVGPRRDYLELADRLHTRVDVDWPPLCLAGVN